MAFRDNFAYIKPLRWGESLFLVFNFFAIFAVLVLLAAPTDGFFLGTLLYFLAIVFSISALQRIGFTRIPELQRSDIVRKRLTMMAKHSWLFRNSLKVPLILWVTAFVWKLIVVFLTFGLLLLP